jgi:hypothetical protein
LRQLSDKIEKKQCGRSKELESDLQLWPCHSRLRQLSDKTEQHLTGRSEKLESDLHLWLHR